MIKRFTLWLWERRLAHARTVRASVEKDFAREVVFRQHEVEHCETMVAQARMAVVRARADKTKARRTREQRA